MPRPGPLGGATPKPRAARGAAVREAGEAGDQGRLGQGGAETFQPFGKKTFWDVLAEIIDMIMFWVQKYELMIWLKSFKISD